MEVGVVAVWLLACGALAAAGWPLAAALLPEMPDRGAALALPVALVLLTVVAYWIGHASIVFGLIAGLLVLLVAATLCTRRAIDIGDRGEDEDDAECDPDAGVTLRGISGVVDDLPTKPAAESAAVFLIAFLLLLAIRAVDPAAHPGGGEKFLDFGLLASLLRASHLPPEDFWFAGEPMQYYYGGHLISSLLARLTGTPPRYAYNLALATFYALLVTGAYGLASAIAADHGVSRRASGALGAFFVGFAANLVTALYAALRMLPDALSGAIAAAVADRSALSAEALLRSPSEYSYWTASRVIRGTVNEFPLFAWLNGDLHAHMMSTPFLMLVAALGYAYTRTPATDRRQRRWLVFGACPPLVGLLAVVNTWSLPTAVGVLWLALTFGPAHPATLLPSRLGDRLLVLDGSILARELARTGAALLAGLAVLLGALAWSGPFWLASASGRAVALVAERSTLTGLLLVHGAFLAVFLPYLFDRARPAIDDRLRAGVAVLLALGLALAGGFVALGVFGPLLIVAWLLLRGRTVVPARSSSDQSDGSERSQRSGRLVTSGGYDRSDGIDGAGGGGTEDRDVGDATENSAGRGALGDVGYETVLLLAGVGLIVLVEFLRVDTGAGPGRYNTVFKTYMQVWVLLSVAAGAILARLLGSDAVGDGVRLGRRGATVLVAVLLVSTSLYGAIALADHFSDPEIRGSDGPTIDALAFASATHPEEAAAIRWLDRETGDRQPTIVSAPGVDTYSWTNAPSSLTGVPTVVGWAHEIGYRGPVAYERRVADVDRIYTGTPSQQARLLREYDVRYIYVGPVERERYGEEGGFENRRGLELAFRNEAVRIYAVDRDRLDSRAA
jgi:YYY domain-containing protein